jgi:hypothetical protein
MLPAHPIEDLGESERARIVRVEADPVAVREFCAELALFSP